MIASDAAQPPRDGDAIALRGVLFAYGKGKAILDIPEANIALGESVFLHGPSGSGKTTLLSLISGVVQAQAGTVRILGQDLSQLSASARDTLRGSRLGYIFQGFNLIPYLSAAENIALPCQLHPYRRARLKAATVTQEVIRLARRLDIEGYLDRPVTHLSVGQQQRVAIARAVIGQPSLIIADEPTSSLDADRRDAFIDLLKELLAEAKARQAATTLLFVSHDRSLATHFDRSLSLATINRSVGMGERL